MYIADEPPANNSLKVLSDGVIELIQAGHQTRLSASQFQTEIEELIRERRAKQQKALILVDVNDVSGHDSDVRDAGREMLKADFDALALFGENDTVRLIANWLIKTAGQNERAQFFKSKNDALKWLRSR